MEIQKFKHDADPKKVIAAIVKDGAVIVEGALSREDIALLDNETNYLLDRVDNCQGIFHGYQTKRVGGLVAKSKVAQKMAVDPIVMDVMDHFLLPNCSEYQINLTQLISIGPNEKQQILHPDEGLFPYDHTRDHQSMINVMWAVDDFTTENGATRVAPGSHVWDRDRSALPEEVIQAEMPRGSYLIYLGSTVHGGGTNQTDKYRRGIVMSYCLGWLRQAENQYLAVPIEVARALPERLQQLLGYFVHKPNLGAVDGQDPIYLLKGNADEKVSFRDFMTKEAQELLDMHYREEDSAAWSDLKKGAA